MTTGPVLPDVPRPLARHEARGTAALLFLGSVIVVGIIALLPALTREQALDQRRHQVWRDGRAIDGVIAATTTTELGRKTIAYTWLVDQTRHRDERVVAHRRDFDAFAIGDAIALRIDPDDTEFSVIALDTKADVTDWVPTELLVGILLAGGGVVALWGFRRRHVLRYGQEVPCLLQPTWSSAWVRATYVWRDRTYVKLVDGTSAESSTAAVVLLEPSWPGWPVLGSAESFRTDVASEGWSLSDLTRRWMATTVPATIGGLVCWGALYLVADEGVPSIVRTGASLIVAIVLTWMGRPAKA